MPRGFLRSVTTSRGWRMTMEKMPVQRSVLARLPFVQVCSLHFTWKELSEIRTTLVTSTETLRSPTTLKGSLRLANSLRHRGPPAVAEVYDAKLGRGHRLNPGNYWTI